MSIGMQLSVLCSEDASRVAEADVARETAGSVFGANLLRGQRKACEFWPKGDVPPDFYEPVASNVPALILSGDIDPVTPPSWGEAVAKYDVAEGHYCCDQKQSARTDTPRRKRTRAEKPDCQGEAREHAARR